MIKKVYMYKRFERFWHWTQAFLIGFLALTGFEIHGTFSLFGFKKAVLLHNSAAFALITLIAFAIFWHFTTGEWKQYVPTTKKLLDQVKYYLIGIFRNEAHPVEKVADSKLNPLQRLTYIGYKIFIVPVMVITGLVYYFVAHGDMVIKSVKTIGTVHVIGAFLLIAFTIIHVYMTTTGHTIFSNLKSMITGYEDMEVKEEET